MLRVKKRPQPIHGFFDRPLEEQNLEADLAGLAGHVLVAWMTHAQNLDSGVCRALLIQDVVGVVQEIEVVACFHIHQVGSDLFPVPSHGGSGVFS